MAPAPLSPAEVEREFRALTDDGAHIRCVGTARRTPSRLLALGYVPRHKIALFNAEFYVCDVRKNADLRFAVGYVVHREPGRRTPRVHARVLYKDGSLLWRVASHFARSRHENWIGKGDLKLVVEDGHEYFYSAEHTTDLPFEMQGAMEDATRRTTRVRIDRAAVALIVRRSSDTRLVAYRDFTDPRRRAARRPGALINGGRPIARFTREGNPESLVFVRGYAPDFLHGVLDMMTSHSRLYEGQVDRYRVASQNRRVQYLFCVSPRVAWIGHPQAFTTELSAYGVRTIDVNVPDDLVVPGMEYHYLESEDPPVWMSQIPPGFAGATSPVDPWRGDASAWVERLPVIAEFRRTVLGGQ